MPDPETTRLVWRSLTRLGEAQILLPAALLALLAMVRAEGSRPLATLWMALVALTALLTTASKIAFIGWGFGSVDLDFTGVSGHAMFAAAIYPVLMAILASTSVRPVRLGAIVVGFALAVVIGVSRVILGAHSIAEVVAGLILGAGASGAALGLRQLPPLSLGLVIPLTLAAWLTLMPWHSPPSPTHSMVTRLALTLSGHKVPYTRAQMHRKPSRADTDWTLYPLARSRVD